MRVRRLLRVEDERGIHLRVAARIVEIARLYDCRVTLTKVASGDGLQWGASTHTGSCMLGFARLQVARGDAVNLSVEGPNAEHALEDIATVLESRRAIPRTASFSEALGLQRQIKEALLAEL